MDLQVAMQRWQELDAEHHLHPFSTHHQLAEKGTRVIDRGEGCHIWEADGHKLIDGMAGLWCVQVGYGRERLARTAYEQLKQLSYYNSFFQCASIPSIELSAKLGEILPAGMKRVFFASSGSEANDTVIKSVWYYWNLMGKPGKKHFISRKLGYHGVGIGSASLTGMSFMHGMFDLPLPRFHHIMNPYWWGEAEEGETEEQIGQRAAQALEDKILELGAENVAAFVAEPIQGAGGVIIPPDNYWPAIQAICRKHDILLVADEVICGFGRTGAWWGSETYGIQPDIIAMAKGLSSGYVPISAVAFGARVGDAIFNGEKEYAHGVTYAGHPVAAAVSLENIRIIEEEGLATRAAGPIGAYWREVLTETFKDHPMVGQIRTKGLLACLELAEDRSRRKRFDEKREVGSTCRDLSVKNGLVMRAVRDGMVLSPPLIVTEAQVDEIAAKARKSIDETMTAVGFKG